MSAPYDGFYVIAYATAALGEQPITGAALARALPKLMRPGDPVEAAHAHAAGAVDLFALPTPGATLCLMQGSEASLVGIAGDLVDRALAQGGMTAGDVRGAFLIYCAGCAGAIGGRIDEVLSALRARLAGTPVLGFCTFGEQGFVPEIGNLHANLSVGIVLLG